MPLCLLGWRGHCQCAQHGAGQRLRRVRRVIKLAAALAPALERRALQRGREQTSTRLEVSDENQQTLNERTETTLTWHQRGLAGSGAVGLAAGPGQRRTVVPSLAEFLALPVDGTIDDGRRVGPGCGDADIAPAARRDIVADRGDAVLQLFFRTKVEPVGPVVVVEVGIAAAVHARGGNARAAAVQGGELIENDGIGRRIGEIHHVERVVSLGACTKRGKSHADGTSGAKLRHDARNAGDSGATPHQRQMTQEDRIAAFRRDGPERIVIAVGGAKARERERKCAFRKGLEPEQRHLLVDATSRPTFVKLCFTAHDFRLFTIQHVFRARNVKGLLPAAHDRFSKCMAESDQVKRLKDLETENGRLRRAISDLPLDKLILQEAAKEFTGFTEEA